jgi:hypothetical protein
MLQVQFQVILRLTVSRPVYPSTRLPSEKKTTFLSTTKNILRYLRLILVWGVLSDESTCMQFTRASAAERCKHNNSWVQVPQNPWQCLTLSFGTGWQFCNLLRFPGLRWKYINPLPYGNCLSLGSNYSLSNRLKVKVEDEVILLPTVSRPVCYDIRSPSGTRDQFFFHFHDNYFQRVAVSYWGAPSLTRGRGRNLLVQLLLGLTNAVTHRFKSLRTCNHILLTLLRRCDHFVPSSDSQGYGEVILPASTRGQSVLGLLSPYKMVTSRWTK